MERKTSDILRREDILKATRLGFWAIEIDTVHDKHRMYVDDNMKDILGVEEDSLTSEEYYSHWYNRINDGYYYYVNKAVQAMISTGEIIELEYTWNHPKRGEVPVRCLGYLEREEDGVYFLAGYHRIVGDIVKKSFLGHPGQEMFEYNELKHMIYFHTDRCLLQGEEKKESDFPRCWIERGMVHPYFAESFRNILTLVKEQKDRQMLDLLLKGKEGRYEWFRMETERIGSEEQDVNTLIVSLCPIVEKQMLHLQYVRTNDFYRSILTETEAYIEVDLEENLILSGGGQWQRYAGESLEQNMRYQEIVDRYARLVVLEEDYQEYHAHMSREEIQKNYRDGKSTVYHQFRRKTGNGGYRWMELVIHVFQEQITKKMYALIYLRDIDAKKRRHLDQEWAASRDPLTGVLNRTTFMKWVKQYMEQNAGKEETCALMMFDIDCFKQINDTQGHQTGDEILKTFVKILDDFFGSLGYVGRLGGDEFMVFMRRCEPVEALDGLLERFLSVLHRAEPVPFSSSVGIYLVTGERFDYEEAVKRADEALYESKRSGKDTYRYWK